MKLVYVLIILAAFSGGLKAGYQWRNKTAIAQQIQYERDYQTNLVRAQQQAWQREQSLQKQMELLTHDAQKQLEEVTHFERAAADYRVRELTARYAAGSNSNRADSPAARTCQAERKRATVLAELLAELNELAAVFAAEADRNRISGNACEAAYLTIID